MKRTTSSPELLLRIERGGDLPLRAQLERELREAIRSGRMPLGSHLPSTRVLATDLGLSRGVVVEAYEQLLAEGYLNARHGSMTTVAACQPRANVERAVPIEPVLPVLRYDFRPSMPDTSSFPRRTWLRSLRNVLDESAGAELGYPDARGAAQARAALAAYLNRARGAAAHADRMVMSTGFTQAFRLVCRVLRRRGATAVAVEDPAHDEQRVAIREAGLKPVAVPVDESGLIVDRLQKSDAGAVLVTPAHQFPTGSVLAPQRRAALLEWAARHRALIIEDDYDAEYRYDREPIGSLQGVAPEHVVYIGSASKTLAPSLRLGWIVPPADFAQDIALAKKEEDRGSPTLEQLAFADFLERGEVDRHLRRMRLRYRRRRDVLMAALRARLPQLRVSGIAAGLHLMLELAPAASEDDIVAAAAAQSVGVYGVRSYRARSKTPPALILGYGAIADSAIAEGIRRLASAIEKRG